VEEVDMVTLTVEEEEDIIILMEVEDTIIPTEVEAQGIITRIIPKPVT
jgi:hypothetical protein